MPDSTADIGEMYMALAFLEMSLAENYCNGIPLGHTTAASFTFGPALTDAQVLDSASAHLDTALAINKGTSAQATFVKQATSILKARVLVDQGKFAAARGAGRSAVPSTYSYILRDVAGEGGVSHGHWSIVNSTARVSVGDSFEIVNGAQRPSRTRCRSRRRTTRACRYARRQATPTVVAEDGSTPLFVEQLIWGGSIRSRWCRASTRV